MTRGREKILNDLNNQINFKMHKGLHKEWKVIEEILGYRLLC